MSGNLVTGEPMAGESMAHEPMADEPTRRRLTARQADTVRRLTEAAAEEIREAGYENFSVRDVARRAEVGAATAYTYFASKDHLLTEVFWRRLRALPPVDESGPEAREAKARVIAVLTELALLVSGEPELAAGCTAAMFGTDPDVRQLRIQIGMQIHRRLEAAAGPGNPATGLIELAYFGAMVQAGLGYTTYARMADRLAEAVELILR
ncbi:MAG TPA: helix-turn-helix domain-containing protein [Streptosporangiaceae bacterium]|nr:helix-turn-helix domain-containing protein [Streptosporangiaceae bacterium]